MLDTLFPKNAHPNIFSATLQILPLVFLHFFLLIVLPYHFHSTSEDNSHANEYNPCLLHLSEFARLNYRKSVLSNLYTYLYLSPLNTLKSIFCTPYHMHMQLVNTMTAYSFILHLTNLKEICRS